LVEILTEKREAVATALLEEAALSPCDIASS